MVGRELLIPNLFMMFTTWDLGGPWRFAIENAIRGSKQPTKLTANICIETHAYVVLKFRFAETLLEPSPTAFRHPKL